MIALTRRWGISAVTLCLLTAGAGYGQGANEASLEMTVGPSPYLGLEFLPVFVTVVLHNRSDRPLIASWPDLDPAVRSAPLRWRCLDDGGRLHAPELQDLPPPPWPPDVVTLDPGETRAFAVWVGQTLYDGFPAGEYTLQFTYRPAGPHAEWGTSPVLAGLVLEAEVTARIVGPEQKTEQYALATIPLFRAPWNKPVWRLPAIQDRGENPRRAEPLVPRMPYWCPPLDLIRTLYRSADPAAVALRKLIGVENDDFNERLVLIAERSEEKEQIDMANWLADRVAWQTGGPLMFDDAVIAQLELHADTRAALEPVEEGQAAPRANWLLLSDAFPEIFAAPLSSVLDRYPETAYAPYVLYLQITGIETRRNPAAADRVLALLRRLREDYPASPLGTFATELAVDKLTSAERFDEALALLEGLQGHVAPHRIDRLRRSIEQAGGPPAPPR